MLANIASNLKQIGQIKPKSAVHWIPTNRSLQRSHGVFVIAGTYVSHRKVSVQTIKRLSNILKLARIIFHAPIRQAVKKRWERKILHLICGLTVAVHIFFSVFSQTKQQLKCLLVLVLHHHAFSAHQLI